MWIFIVFFYQSSGTAAELSGLGASLTILVPANSAFDKIDNSTMTFLTSTDVVWIIWNWEVLV